MLVIDGSEGEGGGQVLRTSLALSMITGTPFRLENVRARRQSPGLKRQHLTGVLAAAELCAAEVQGAHVGSRTVEFNPRTLSPGTHVFDIGTAGSTALVLQAVLPALLCASAPSTLEIHGGTYAKMAPPWDFLAHAFLRLLRRMGARVEATLVRPGFFPAGGGLLQVDVEPVEALRPLELDHRGGIIRRHARALVSNLPETIARRELDVVAHELGWPQEELDVVVVRNAPGPGNVVVLEIECEHVTEVFTGFGQRGVAAEDVARQATSEAKAYLVSGAPVGTHLADQLMLPLALAGAGSYRTLPLTPHATTNASIIERFLPVRFETRDLPDGSVEVRLGPVLS